MDDFSVYGGFFDLCSDNLTKVLHRCEKVNLILNWKKCHLMVQEGVVLGMWYHKGVLRLINKIEVIRRLLPPTCVKGGAIPWACGFLSVFHQEFF